MVDYDGYTLWHAIQAVDEMIADLTANGARSSMDENGSTILQRRAEYCEVAKKLKEGYLEARHWATNFPEYEKMGLKFPA